LIVVFLPVLAVCGTAYGQGFGVIAGKITDPSGAVIAGANITATNSDTNTRVTAVSNGEGVYQVFQLIPGRYSLQAEAAGFKTLKREGVTVQVSDRLSIDLKLELGQTREVVSITAEAPLLRAQDSQVGEVVNGTFLLNLPQLQRDPLQLLTIAGNVQGSGARATGGKGSGGSDTRINGGRTSAIEYLVDGISTATGVSHGVTSVTPGMDVVAEFKVITNGISAEYGRMSGGGVEVVTKSGGNQLHGQLFEYFKNDKLNASSWSQNALGGEKTPFRNNDFGFALGGPVFLPKLYNGKNRTFFFANYEGVRFSQSGMLNTTSVPTAEEREGNFTNSRFDGVAALMYDPDAADSTLKNVTNADGSVTQLRTVLLGEDGKHVPLSRMSPLAVALQKLVPLPNIAGRANTSSSANYMAPSSTTSSSNTFGVRIDHNISDNHRLFARFSHQSSDWGQTAWKGPLTTAGGSKNPGAYTAALNYDWTMSPTLLFNARLGGTFTPSTNGSVYPGDIKSTIASLPFDSVTRSILGDSELPIIQVYSGNPTTVIADSGFSSTMNSTSYNANASLTKILTKHTLKFGFETRRYYDNFISNGASSWPYGGWWQINSNPINEIIGDGADNALRSTAGCYGAYLLGRMGYDPISGSTSRAEAFNYYAGYIQDDYRVTPRLTVNLGLRWDMETPLTERYDRFYFWDPDAKTSFGVASGFNWNSALTAAGIDPATVTTPAWVKGGFQTGGLMLPNTAEHPERTVFGYHPWQFAPRVGLAYQLTPKTVIRASFAQMYITTMANPNSNATDADISLGSAASGGWHSGSFAHYVNTFENPYHAGTDGGSITNYTRDIAVANAQASAYNTVVSGYNKNEHMPYELTWSFGIQRELPKGFLVEATYSANQGHGLLGPDSVSQFPSRLFVPSNSQIYSTKIPTPFTGTSNTSPVSLAILEMAYPYYGGVRVLGNNNGRSNYNSLNLRAERRLWQGMTFLVNYTYSKLLDNVGGAEGDADNSVDTGRGGKLVQSVDSIEQAYGYSPYDEKHRLSATYSVELPFGRGKAFLGHPQGFGQALLDGVVGGWQFAGTGVYRSGRPIIFGYNAANTNNPYGVEYTFGSYTTTNTNLLNPSFAGVGSVVLSTADSRAGVQGVFDTSLVTDAKTFTYGTLPPVYSRIRNPGNGTMDLSLMKKFPLGGDGSRYVQFRVEAQNAFNIRGTIGYNTTVGSADFGYIVPNSSATIANNTERQAQVSARIIF
jgi:hypothetical protein